MKNHRYILQPYKSLSDRYTCPSCREKKKFARYIDIQNNSQLSEHCGRCERSDSCGYHYTPSDYFKENPNNKPTDFTPFTIVPAPPKREASYIDKSVFEKSLSGYEANNFVKFLSSTFGNGVTELLTDKYKIGTTSKGATVFYQIDLSGNVRSGKIIKYNLIETENTFHGRDCKRDKNIMPSWIHKALMLEDFFLSQCLFGEHLLTDKSKPVAIVESEKSAVISSIYYPQYTWLSCGGKEGLSTVKIQALKGFDIVLFPDLGGFDKWTEKVKEIRGVAKSVKIFDLTTYATEEERASGFDIADYLLRSEPPTRKEIESIKLIEQVELLNSVESKPPNSDFNRVVNILQWFAKCSYLYDGTAVLFSGEVIHDCLAHIKDLHFQVQDYQNEEDLIKAVERLESIKAIFTDKPPILLP